jgi:hypothetical protein
MADRVRKVSYCHVSVPNRAGQGAKMLGALQEAGVNLVAYTGFPSKAGKSQLDFVTDDMAGLRRVARKGDWRLSKTKRGFLVQGDDKLGAAHRLFERLAGEKINVVAAEAVAAGKGRYGMMLWVNPKSYARAAKVLKAK